MANEDQARRIAVGIQQALAEIIRREVKHPRVAEAHLSVSHVDINRDGSVANCYISVFGDNARDKQAVIAGLKRAAGFLRGPVARANGLRRAPELRFFLDEGAEVREQLAALVEQDDARSDSE